MEGIHAELSPLAWRIGTEGQTISWETSQEHRMITRALMQRINLGMTRCSARGWRHSVGEGKV